MPVHIRPEWMQTCIDTATRTLTNLIGSVADVYQASALHGVVHFQRSLSMHLALLRVLARRQLVSHLVGTTMLMIATPPMYVQSRPGSSAFL